jgi:hypothetical protein
MGISAQEIMAAKWVFTLLDYDADGERPGRAHAMHAMHACMPCMRACHACVHAMHACMPCMPCMPCTCLCVPVRVGHLRAPAGPAPRQPGPAAPAGKVQLADLEKAAGIESYYYEAQLEVSPGGACIEQGPGGLGRGRARLDAPPGPPSGAEGGEGGALAVEQPALSCLNARTAERVPAAPRALLS